MKKLSRIQIALRCGSLLVAWLVALGWFFVALPDAYRMTWRENVVWFAIAVAVVILYSLPPNVLCRNLFTMRLAFVLYCGVVVGCVVGGLWLVFKLFGTSPEFGSSRTWGIFLALFMTLCALSGPVGLLLHREDGQNGVKEPQP
jgi:hypothetical protein